jgi:predicted RNA-binding Zn-ribbon protein involved in translation (DUF1610 family)
MCWNVETHARVAGDALKFEQATCASNAMVVLMKETSTDTDASISTQYLVPLGACLDRLSKVSVQFQCGECGVSIARHQAGAARACIR